MNKKMKLLILFFSSLYLTTMIIMGLTFDRIRVLETKIERLETYKMRMAYSYLELKQSIDNHEYK